MKMTAVVTELLMIHGLLLLLRPCYSLHIPATAW